MASRTACASSGDCAETNSPREGEGRCQRGKAQSDRNGSQCAEHHLCTRHLRLKPSSSDVLEAKGPELGNLKAFCISLLGDSQPTNTQWRKNCLTPSLVAIDIEIGYKVWACFSSNPQFRSQCGQVRWMRNATSRSAYSNPRVVLGPCGEDGSGIWKTECVEVTKFRPHKFRIPRQSFENNDAVQNRR